jgi:hypothetical protein
MVYQDGKPSKSDIWAGENYRPRAKLTDTLFLGSPKHPGPKFTLCVSRERLAVYLAGFAIPKVASPEMRNRRFVWFARIFGPLEVWGSPKKLHHSGVVIAL